MATSWLRAAGPSCLFQGSLLVIANQQPIEKRKIQEDGVVEVVHIWNTIQGEGPHAGRPAVFIRLAGCNLQCPLCDTDYTTARRKFLPMDLADQLEAGASGFKTNLVVITGGEPFRQNLGPLLECLYSREFNVQIETNGTLPPTFDARSRARALSNKHQNPDTLMVVCSPKTPRINPELWPFIHALKYVVAADNVHMVDGLPTNVLGMELSVARPPRSFPLERIYIQPLDEQDEKKNIKNLETARVVCMKFGYRLCLQVHKIAGLP